MIKKVILLFLFCSSCNFHTSVNYQQNRKEEYIREEGFIISCQSESVKDKDILVVNTFTPSNSKGYYTYLNGKKSDKHVKVLDVEALFLDTRDTLEFLGIHNEKYYSFYYQNLKEVIDKNKKLRIIIHVQDLSTAEIEKKEFVLTRKKRTYPTGTFPHA